MLGVFEYAARRVRRFVSRPTIVGPMQQSNPAVLRQTSVTPLLLEAVAEDPTILQELAVKMTMVQIDAVHRMLDNPNISLNQRLSTIETLSKIGQIGAYGKTQAVQGNGSPSFSVNIVMGPNDKKQSITVDTKLVEDATSPAIPNSEQTVEQPPEPQLVELSSGND